MDDKKPCKMAVYDGGWRSAEIGGGWLRIRRSQVRVLPSAPSNALQESYNEIVSQVRIKDRSSLQYPWEQD
jgi:hypothetical protein